MIILDTNIVSEFMGTPPSREVRDWLKTQSASDLYLTSVSAAEILVGLAIMSDGRRKSDLTRDFNDFEKLVIGDRMLGFERSHAPYLAEVICQRRAAGRPVDFADAQIAAIALARGFAVATRNVRDFEGVGLTLVDPFNARP